MPEFTRALLERAGGEPGAPLVFTASTPGVKRDGLDLRASGWRTDTFARNPVFLWAHNRTAPPIGRVEPVVEEGALRAAVTFDQGDEFARTIERKYREGFLNAVSVGWDFVDADGQRLGWRDLTDEKIRDEAFYDLTELSGVPVPADPDALIERERAGLRSLGYDLLTAAGADLTVRLARAVEGHYDHLHHVHARMEKVAERPLLVRPSERVTPKSSFDEERIRSVVTAELERLGLISPPAGEASPDQGDEDKLRDLLAAFTREGTR